MKTKCIKTGLLGTVLFVVISLLFDNYTLESRNHPNLHKNNTNYIVANNDYSFSKPWTSLQLNITSILQNWQKHNISTSLPTNYKLTANIERIFWMDEVPKYFKTCVNITSTIQQPIGIPNISSSNLLNTYNTDLDKLCFVHLPGFLHSLGGLATIQKKYFDINWMDHFDSDNSLNIKCWRKHNKIINLDQNLDAKIVNIAIPILGPLSGINSAHFQMYIPMAWSIMLEVIMNLKSDTFYNISLITHLNGIIGNENNYRNFKAYFWRKMNLSWTQTNVFNHYINITFVPWLQQRMGRCSSRSNVFYSPFMITAYVIRSREKYKNINPRSYVFNHTQKQIYMSMPRNGMWKIKSKMVNFYRNQSIVLYLNRGGNVNGKRNIVNNNEVIDKLRLFVQENQNIHPYKFEIFAHGNRESDKDIFSKAAIIIGPHGGALQNINHAQNGSVVVEFIDFWIDQRKTGNQPFRSCYYALAQANGLKYYYLKPDNLTFDFNVGAMQINIQSLLTLMNQIYKL